MLRERTGTCCSWMCDLRQSDFKVFFIFLSVYNNASCNLGLALVRFWRWPHLTPPPTLALVSKLFGMCVALSADPSALLCCEIWIAAANDALDLQRAAPSILQPGKCGA